MTIFRKLWQSAVKEAMSSLARYADGGLRLNEFTALLGVRGDLRELAKRLQQEDAKASSAQASGIRRLRDDGEKPSEKSSGVRSRRPDGEGSGMLVSGVHSLRWVLFQPEVHQDDSENTRTRARFVLVLSFVFDGDVQDALEELCQQQATLDILSFCTGFARKNAVEYLKARRVKSGFMFRDLGPLREPDGPDEPREFDATRSEIEDAFDVQERFEKFYATHPPTSRDLQQAFLGEFAKDTFPFVPTPFERPLPDEPRIARRVSEVIRSGQERTARSSKDRPRRGAHTKGHGLIRGTLRVEPDIPPHLAKGLFAAAGETFDVVARSSNGAPRRDCDRKRDERGLAISVVLPLHGEGGFAPEQFLFPPEQQSRGRQDFVLNSDPEFFAANLREALTIFSILSTTAPAELAARTGAFVIGNAAYRQSWLLLRGVFARAVRHPLLPALHSATPYVLGEDHVVKYSAELDNPEDLSRYKVKWAYSYLRRALRDSLEQRPIEMGLYVHAVSRSEWPLEKMVNAVEDATTDFSTLDACKVRVATIRFERQDPGTPERMREAERWSFSPWNALKMHRPIGSINRGRLLIYHNSAHLRAQAAAGQQHSDDSGEVPSDRSGSQAAE
jgi:hypothetical protein